MRCEWTSATSSSIPMPCSSLRRSSTVFISSVKLTNEKKYFHVPEQSGNLFDGAQTPDAPHTHITPRGILTAKSYLLLQCGVQKRPKAQVSHALAPFFGGVRDGHGVAKSIYINIDYKIIISKNIVSKTYGILPSCMYFYYLLIKKFKALTTLTTILKLQICTHILWYKICQNVSRNKQDMVHFLMAFPSNH